MTTNTAPQAAKRTPQATRSTRPWYRRNPWANRLPRPLAGLERDFENFMDHYFGGSTSHAPVWTGFVPVANLAESNERYEVTVELPGVKPEEVHVELRNGDLWISGEKREEPKEKDTTFHRVERSFGEFRRVIPMPGDVEENTIEANCKEGVLRIVLPKSRTAKPKPIVVKS